jgi:poly(ADP-ribose) glycohydrolase ARH3
MDSADAMRDRFRGALLGCVLGDSFGSVLEGFSLNDQRLERLVSRRRAQRQPWRYTDDTEMALGVVRSLLDCGGLNDSHLMETWSDNYDPARGYGKGMKLAISAWRAGDRAPAEAAWRDGSNGSGAAVRVVAIALLHHADQHTLEAAARQSSVLTHRGALAVDGCALQASALAQVLHQSGATVLDATNFVTALRGAGALSKKLARLPALLGVPPRDAVAELGNGVTADESVPLALYAFLRWLPDFEEIIVNAALCGGDVDTIGAMSGALAGALLGERALPQLWLENAEGVDETIRLADRLYELWVSRVAR